MKRHLAFEEYFECSVDRLWQAITDSRELEAWLMANDFLPEVGHRFSFENRSGSGPRTIQCEVLQLSPPVRMTWNWEIDGEMTEVIFELSSTTDKRTRLKLLHTGIQDPRMAKILQNGWPTKLRRLVALVHGA